jgi:hypothetical protein
MPSIEASILSVQTVPLVGPGQIVVDENFCKAEWSLQGIS